MPRWSRLTLALAARAQAQSDYLPQWPVLELEAPGVAGIPREDLAANWPTADTGELDRRLANICRGPLADAGPFAYWIAHGWGPEGPVETLAPLVWMDVRGRRLDLCHVQWPTRELLDLVWLLGRTFVIGVDDRLLSLDGWECRSLRYGCYDAVRDAARELLASELVEHGRYHVALEAFVLAKHPDMTSPSLVPLAIKTVLSSWDGLLDAEAELGVAGTADVTAAFAVVERPGGPEYCYGLRAPIGCAGEDTLRNFWDAVHDRLDTGYRPHNDLPRSYATRWVHAFSNPGALREVPELLQGLYRYAEPADERPSVALDFRGRAWS